MSPATTFNPVGFVDRLWRNPNLDAQFRDVEGMGSGNLVNEALNLLNTITITTNTAAATDTTSFLRDYDAFLVTYENIRNATTNRQPLLSVQVGGTFQTTTYIGTTTLNTGGTITGAAITTSPALGPLTPNSTLGANGWFFVFNPAGAARNHILIGRAEGVNSTPAIVSNTWMAYYNGATTAVTGFQIAMSGGNIASCIIRTYGIRNT
jgi:hypothetical protein